MVNLDLALAASILPSGFGPYHLLHVVGVGSLETSLFSYKRIASGITSCTAGSQSSAFGLPSLP